MGVRGAALATLTARILECAVMLRIVYRRRALLALHLKDLLGLDLSFIGRVFKPMLPVTLNETLSSSAPPPTAWSTPASAPTRSPP